MLSVSLRIPSFFILDNGLLYFLVREIHFAIIQLTTSDRFIFKIIASWHVDGEMVETVADYFPGLQDQCRCFAAMKLKDAYSLEGKL